MDSFTTPKTSTPTFFHTPPSAEKLHTPQKRPSGDSIRPPEFDGRLVNKKGVYRPKPIKHASLISHSNLNPEAKIFQPRSKPSLSQQPAVRPELTPIGRKLLELDSSFIGSPDSSPSNTSAASSTYGYDEEVATINRHVTQRRPNQSSYLPTLNLDGNQASAPLKMKTSQFKLPDW